MIKATITLRTLLLAASLAASAARAAGAIEINLSTRGNDIAFDREAVEVPFGHKVTVEFRNKAAKDSEILHNIAVLKPGTLDDTLKELQKVGYDLDKMRGSPHIIAMTKSLKPGESGTVEFNPDKPGAYPFICLMAGHADMLGMKGELKVVKK